MLQHKGATYKYRGEEKGVKPQKEQTNTHYFHRLYQNPPQYFLGLTLLHLRDAARISSIAGVYFHLFWQEDCFVGWAYNTILKAIADKNITIRIRTMISFVIAIIFPLFDP